MTNHAYLAGIALLATAALFGTATVVKHPPGGAKLAATAPGSAPASAADPKAMAQAMWTERALPYLRDKAAPFDDLRAAIAADAEQAGAKYGYRARGAGLAWHYVATVAGTVLEADTAAVFPVLRVDTDADGQADAELQCGPIFANTSLRDALPFVSFATFDNQIAWGEFGVALNDLAHANAGRPACAGAAPGKPLTVLATFTRDRGGRLPLLTPVLLEGEQNDLR